MPHGTVARALEHPRNVPDIITETDRRRLVAVADVRREARSPRRHLLAGVVRCAVHGSKMTGAGERYLCRADGSPHLSVRCAPVHDIVLPAVDARAASHPWTPSALDDPTDELVREREEVYAEMDDVARSRMPLRAKETATEALQERADAIDARIVAAEPVRRSFAESVSEARGDTPAAWVRRYVAAVTVAPAEGRGRAFDPARLSIVWTDGTTTSGTEAAAIAAAHYARDEADASQARST
jgi:site-specific DNA recombinase